jgi:hypothetical protein
METSAKSKCEEVNAEDQGGLQSDVVTNGSFVSNLFTVHLDKCTFLQICFFQEYSQVI